MRRALIGYGGSDQLNGGAGVRGGIDKVYGEVGDNCLPGSRGTGDLVDCERTDP